MLLYGADVTDVNRVKSFLAQNVTRETLNVINPVTQVTEKQGLRYTIESVIRLS